MNSYENIFGRVIADARYLENILWGEPRPGHTEGTVKAHIDQLEGNLETLRPGLSSDDYWRLRILIHVHDSFKAEADPKAAITDPKSHASLAAAFLAEHCDDEGLRTMVQFHDEPYALWRQAKAKGACNPQRLSKLLETIQDWPLFIRFCMIDGFTPGKSSEPLQWLVENLARRVELEPFARDTLANVRGERS